MPSPAPAMIFALLLTSTSPETFALNTPALLGLNPAWIPDGALPELLVLAPEWIAPNATTVTVLAAAAATAVA